MKIERLVEMANDIGNYFKYEPDKSEARSGICNHISKFWEPRMQEQIIEYVDKGGNELDPLVKDAVKEVKKSRS